MKINILIAINVVVEFPTPDATSVSNRNFSEFNGLNDYIWILNFNKIIQAATCQK